MFLRKKTIGTAIAALTKIVRDLEAVEDEARREAASVEDKRRALDLRRDELEVEVSTASAIRGKIATLISGV